MVSFVHNSWCAGWDNESVKDHPCDFCLNILLPSPSLKVPAILPSYVFFHQPGFSSQRSHMSKANQTHKYTKKNAYTLSSVHQYQTDYYLLPIWPCYYRNTSVTIRLWQISCEYDKLIYLLGGRNQTFSTIRGQIKLWLIHYMQKQKKQSE